MTGNNMDVSISEKSNIEKVNPYSSPQSKQAKFNIESIKFNRTALATILILVLVSIAFIFGSLQYGRMLGVGGFATLLAYFLYLVFGLVSLVFVFRLNQLTSSTGKAIFLVLLSLIPMLNIYVSLRSIIVANKIIRTAV